MTDVIFFAFYLLARLVRPGHFTARREDRGLEWVVYLVAVAVFPVMWFTA